MILCAVDAESNGLHGQPFAVAAVLLGDAGIEATFVDRCPITGPIDRWVQDNVLPAIAHMPLTSPDYETMLGNLRQWRETVAIDVPVIAHVAWPVEARLFADIYGHDPELAFAGPYPLHDLASMLWLAGEEPTSAEDYLYKHGPAEDYLYKHGLAAPAGYTHDPRYDAHCTALVAQHLFTRFNAPDERERADAPR